MELAQISALEGKACFSWDRQSRRENFRFTCWRVVILLEERAGSNSKDSSLWLDWVIQFQLSLYFRHVSILFDRERLLCTSVCKLLVVPFYFILFSHTVQSMHIIYLIWASQIFIARNYQLFSFTLSVTDSLFFFFG